MKNFQLHQLHHTAHLRYHGGPVHNQVGNVVEK